MLCAISGESPQVPVASAKSGNVFEKRLIEAYISENGKDPVTGEDLTTEDLIELKSSRIVRPRPPTLTSIPSLLSVFQNEWDALALETYTLRQHLTQVRQELSSALYENDAAKRVIARLSRERDEARDALSKIGLDGPPNKANGSDSMQIDSAELPAALVTKVEETQEKLSKTRRKRAVPEDWATAETIESFKPGKSSKAQHPGSTAIAVDTTGDLALFGGADGDVTVYSVSKAKAAHHVKAGAAVTDVLWAGKTAVVSTASGEVKGYSGKKETFSFSGHAGQATALALHPCEEILASVGEDKTYIFYDLTSLTQILQISTNAALSTAQFHPDGHLFAAGSTDGQIKLFDVKTGINAADFKESGMIQALSFSENGTWLAAAVKGSSTVSIWDLRKATQIKTLDTGGPVSKVRWDYTGQFLASAGPSGLAIQQYSKSTKEWSEPLRTALPSTAADWGLDAQKLVTVNAEGAVTVLSAE